MEIGMSNGRHTVSTIPSRTVSMKHGKPKNGIEIRFSTTKPGLEPESDIICGKAATIVMPAISPVDWYTDSIYLSVVGHLTYAFMHPVTNNNATHANMLLTIFISN